MEMIGQERKTWLSQITRIHKEQKHMREREFLDQAVKITELRAREQEAGFTTPRGGI